MRVAEWMTPEPLTVTVGASLLHARRLIRHYGIRHLPVVDGLRVVGMLSDRDVLVRDDDLTRALRALRSELLAGRDRPVTSVMSAPVLMAEADEPVEQAAERMLRSGVSGLPVLEQGMLVGIITTSDCLRALVTCRRTAAAGRARPDAAGRGP